MYLNSRVADRAGMADYSGGLGFGFRLPSFIPSPVTAARRLLKINPLVKAAQMMPRPAAAFAMLTPQDRYRQMLIRNSRSQQVQARAPVQPDYYPTTPVTSDEQYVSSPVASADQSLSPQSPDQPGASQADQYAQYGDISPASSGSDFDLTVSDSSSTDADGDNTSQGMGSLVSDIFAAYSNTQQPATATVPTTTQATDQATGVIPGIMSSLVSVWQQKKIADINTERLKQGLPPLDTGAISPQVNVGLDPKLRTALLVGGAGALGLLAFVVFRRKRR